MKLELDLLELNELYLATDRLVKQYDSELQEYGGDYFKSLHERSIVLRDKIQTALHNECKVLDDARDYVRNYKVSNADADADALQRRDYARFTEYADKLAAEQYDTEREQLKSKKLFTLNQNR